MAEKEDLNLGKDKDSAADDAGSGGKGKRIVIVVVVVLLLAGGGVAGYFLMADGGEEAGDATTEDIAEEEPQVPLYLDMAKLLVNLEHEGRTRYVQAEMQLMSYDERVIEQAQRDMPAIRDRLIILFSSQDFAALKTVEGKEALRGDAVAMINTVLGLKPPGVIREVYFENFVLQ